MLLYRYSIPFLHFFLLALIHISYVSLYPMPLHGMKTMDVSVTLSFTTTLWTSLRLHLDQLPRHKLVNYCYGGHSKFSKPLPFFFAYFRLITERCLVDIPCALLAVNSQVLQYQSLPVSEQLGNWLPLESHTLYIHI